MVPISLEQKRIWAEKRREMRIAQHNPEACERKHFFSAVAVTGSIVAALLLICTAALADSLPKMRVVYAIIGEAEGEPYRGKLAVACAIQNRGTLKGVYGETSYRVKNRKYSSNTLVQAIRAYEESLHPANCQFIDRADHWEGTEFPSPYWAAHMIKTATVGKQAFYRASRGE